MKKLIPKIKATLFFLFLISFTNAISQTTILHLKPGISAGKDVFLASGAPTINYGNHEELSGTAWTCGGNPCFSRGLFQFDLSSIPVGAGIVSAHISLFANPSPINANGIPMQGTNEAVLQRVTSAWDESVVTWNSSPGTTTVNEVTLVESSSSFEDYIDIEVQQLVQDMVNNPSSSFGFQLKLTNETPLTAMIFASSDFPDSTLWPEITIEYSDSAICVEKLVDDGGADVYLASGAPSNNYGNHPELAASGWTCSGNPCIARGLISFDLSTIPATSHIVSAQLDLYAHPNPANYNGISMQGLNEAVLQRVTSTWSENGVTWSSAPTSTNQNQVSLAQSTSSYQNYLNIDVAGLVQDMINDPVHSFGFMLRLVDETPSACMDFASKDYSDASLHPKLTVCYVPTIGINELENLHANINVFPNPFNDVIKINIDLRTDADIRITLMDMLCRNIKSEEKGKVSAGIYSYEINSGIDQLPAAAYFIRIDIGNKFIMKRIMKN